MKKIAFITGATAGIGQATSYRLAAEGYSLIITGRREEKLTDLKQRLEEQYPISVLPLTMDVRVKADTQTSIRELPEEWKDIELLVNNAGLAVGLDPFDQANLADWETMIDTNIKGLLVVSRAVLDLMIGRKRGHIINLSSIAGTQVYAKGNVYCATKHAVDAITQSMRIDLLTYGIRVSSVSPGAVDTEFSTVRFKGDEQKAKSVYEDYDPLLAEDIADVIAFIATRPAHVNINDIEVTPTAQANAYYLHKGSFDEKN